MSFDFTTLEPLVRDILTSPGTDLSQISAKGVRQRLTNMTPELTPKFIRLNKKSVDEVITGVYATVSAEQTETGAEKEATDEETNEASEGRSSETRKRKQESDEEDGNAAENDEDEEPVTKKARKGPGANGTGRKAGRPRKSAATVESDAESEEQGRRKKSKRKPAGEGGGARGGFAKEYALSESLAQVLGTERLSRPQVVKQLWIYIKENKLQNPKNGKEILLDEKLRAVFGSDKIDMFAMNKALSKHLSQD